MVWDIQTTWFIPVLAGNWITQVVYCVKQLDQSSSGPRHCWCLLVLWDVGGGKGPFVLRKLINLLDCQTFLTYLKHNLTSSSTQLEDLVCPPVLLSLFRIFKYRSSKSCLLFFNRAICFSKWRQICQSFSRLVSTVLYILSLKNPLNLLQVIYLEHIPHCSL